MCLSINSMRKMFNACEMDNHNVECLLNLGKTQINAGKCCYLLGAVKNIEKLLQVTLMQNVFRHAVKLDIVHDDDAVARGGECMHHEYSI